MDFMAAVWLNGNGSLIGLTLAGLKAYEKG